MDHMKLATCIIAVCTSALIAAETSPAQIKFSNVSQQLGNKPAKPKGFGEKMSPEYLEWPFDLVFMDINGDGNWDLFMLDHHGAPYHRLWLGDGKGKLISV